MTNENQNMLERNPSIVWNFFKSLKLTIALLIILAVASIIGTLVPQRESAVSFAAGLSPEMRQLFLSLNLFDMYHAFWFRLLIGVLALNLMVCSIDRFPHTWKKFRTKPGPDRSKPFDDLPAQQTALVKGDLDGAAERVDHFLKDRYRGLQRKAEKGVHYFSGEKGRYALFGVYLVHLSILVVIVGALVGSFFGFEAFVNINEGETTGTVFARKGGNPMPLGFQVRCDKFSVEYYKEGAPKEYRSEVAFLVDGREVEKKSLLVNHPATFKGVTFYQASFGSSPGKKVAVRITRTASAPEVTDMEVERGNWIGLPGKEGKFQVAEVDPNLMGVMGPAALISVQPVDGKEARFWIFKNREALEKQFPGMMEHNPKLNASLFPPYTFALNNLETKYYTGLQVNRDPGVWVVWLGCFMMIAGFLVTFFAYHRRIWVRVAEEKGDLRISVAGTAAKNPIGLERELGRLTNDLEQLFRTGER